MLGNVKNEQKRGRVALFLNFGVCKIRCRFGPVLGSSGAGFGTVFGRFWAISGLFFPCLQAHGFGMFFLTLAGRLMKRKLVDLAFLSLFRFGPKFASQLASFPRSYFAYFSGRLLAYFGYFQRHFFPHFAVSFGCGLPRFWDWCAWWVPHSVPQVCLLNSSNGQS